jgi:hypothetical protein
MDSEIARGKWLLVAGAFFLASIVVCYGEIMYLMTGKDVQATVASAKLYRNVNTDRKVLTIEYEFTDAENNHRKRTDNVDPAWEAKIQGGKVPVRYRPGKDGSARLAGEVNWFGPIFLGVSLLGLGYAGFLLWKEANDTGPRKPKRSTP